MQFGFVAAMWSMDVAGGSLHGVDMAIFFDSKLTLSRAARNVI